MNEARFDSSDVGHKYDYYFRPGDELRPAPARIKHTPRFDHLRQFLLQDVRDVTPGAMPMGYDDYQRRYVDQFWEGDELMDNLVLSFKTKPEHGGKRAYEQAMAHGIETVENPSEELVALIAQLDNVPDWVDMEMVERGARIFSNIPGGYYALGLAAGTVLTTTGASFSLAVGSTGRFRRQREHRFIESSTLWTSLCEPGGMRRFGRGVAIASHIRMMHAFVRNAMYRKEGLFDFDTHGDPVPNADSIAGIPVFGIANFCTMKAFGLRVKREEMEALDMMHRYMVYLMGGNPMAFPESLEESEFALDFALASAGEPSKFTEEMNKVFFNDIGEAIKSRCNTKVEALAVEFISTQVVAAFLWYMLGEEMCKQLNYVKKPNVFVRYLPHMLTLFNRTFKGVQTFDKPHNEAFTMENRIALFKKIFKIEDKEVTIDFKGHDNTTPESLSA